VAADYAATTDPDTFRASASASIALSSQDVLQAPGVTLPWESRASVNVYLAAPDFDFTDRQPINAVAEALRYHNFVPRLPVRENGQMGLNATPARKAKLLAADLALLDECQIVVAVLTYNDPGTLIEIGIACERKMPVIVYDLSCHTENLVLTGLPTLVTDDIERVISCVYQQAAES
jgi:nucleoside 2-deoxyribosyltransferase